MSWFGGGKKKDADDGPAEVVDSSGGFDNASFTPSSPAASFPSSGPSAGAAPAGGGAAAQIGPREQAAMQQQILAMQEGAVVQGLILKLTDLAFDQCVDKPSNALKSGERACINSVVLKYLDTGKLIAGPPQRQAE